jgi:RNA polymerase sigma factor for flagellar operon FliA
MKPQAKTVHQLIAECQGLVRSLALGVHRNLPAHVELDDLIAYGQVGLAEAARDFDPRRGGQFSTFCYYRIRGAIYDGLSQMSWVKRSHYKRIKYEQMANDVLRLEADNQAAEASPPDDLRWLQHVGGLLAVVYLSTRRSGDDDSQELELADPAQELPQNAVIDREIHEKLNELIDALPAESSFLIRATYFEGLTLKQAGDRLGVGKPWASRLHAKALGRLARSLRLAGVAD